MGRFTIDPFRIDNSLFSYLGPILCLCCFRTIDKLDLPVVSRPTTGVSQVVMVSVETWRTKVGSEEKRSRP